MTEVLVERLRAALSDRYAIERELGAGGMATVYLAHDVKHDRKVAVKVLRPELAAALGTERFLNEVRVTAKLNHPHILPLLDSGTAEEPLSDRPTVQPSAFLFYVMPFVEGDSLKSRIENEHQLPVDETVTIAKGIASALDHAHRLGVVHRDVKPENILLQDGQPIVADFGVALAFNAATGERLTETGLSLGTPHYMSPEQSAAEEDLDGRSDLYALGCVVYEMLVGEPPFTGPNPQAILARHMSQNPPEVSVVRKTVSQGINRAVLKALAKTPADRFRTCGEFADALEAPDSRNHVDTAKKSIAVLPFTNMSADPDNHYFCDGVAEEIINSLTQVQDLRVVGRASAFTFRAKEHDLRAIGEKLGVRTVLDGSVRKAGAHLRITVQLTDVGHGYQLWSERFDRELDDVFAIQDEIAVAVADRLQLTFREGPGGRRQTDNVEAYELYLQGRGFLYQRGMAMMNAAQCFEDALALDPEYALAYAGLADAYSILGYYGLLTPADAWPRAREAARRALELGPELAESHCAMAIIAAVVDWDWALVEQEFLKALELNRSYIQARCWYALAYVQNVCARHDEAISETRRATELDPLSAYAHAIHGLVLWQARRNEEALSELHQAVELDPDSYLARWCLAMCLHSMSDYADAEAAYRHAIALSGRHSWAVTHLGIMLADSGRLDEANAAYAELAARAQLDYVQPTLRAMLAAAIGRADEAIELAYEGCDERDAFLLFSGVCQPHAERLRGIPRFREVLERMGLNV